MPIPKKYRAGQRKLSAAQLNDQMDQVGALSGLQVTGDATFQREGGTYTLNVNKDEGGFWARIDDEDTAEGTYAWTEMELLPDGTYSVLTDGRTGTIDPVSNPAREWSGKKAVPVEMIVWMEPGTAAENPVDATQVDRGYIFVCPDLLQLVRITDGPRNADGDYDGYIQRYDPLTNSWVDSTQIWVRNAN